MAPNLVNKLKRLRNQSDHHQHKLSAVLMYKGRPLSFGFNSLKTDPKIQKYSKVKAMHAEMSAVFRVKNKEMLKDCTIVVYREDRHGNPVLARPCSVCETMLKDYGIKHIMYSSKEGWIEECL